MLAITKANVSAAVPSLGYRIASGRVAGDGRAEWYWYDPSAPLPPDTPFKKPFDGLPELPPLE